MNTAELINVLARFCGKRNLANLTQKSLYHQYGMNQVDVFVLFGGSILEGGDVLAQAINAKLAKKYIIVGGAGHTTETLRKIVSQQLDIGDIEKLSEAEIFNSYTWSIMCLGRKSCGLSTKSRSIRSIKKLKTK